MTATLSPVPGSKIGAVYRLPTGWNGKLVGYGGGGWAGNVRLETGATEIARGYATMQTDAGHPSGNAGDASWTAPGGKPDDIALTDFSWRGVHTMTEVGKLVAAKYYGRMQEKAYFQGCSTGGRMALMEAQRFPNDYDAIVAGAPVYSLRVQLGEIYRDWVWNQPGAAITPAQITLVHDAVLAQCDAADGVKDGIVGDPKACKFEPASLQCKAGQSGDQCLTPAQVTAFRREYEPVVGKDGVTYVYQFSKGSEPGWLQGLNVTNDPQKAAHARDLDLREIMFGDTNYDFNGFHADRDGPKARSTAFAKTYEAVDPNLKPFLAKGKLILWHGLDDQLPSPWGTAAYYDQVAKTVGPQTLQSMRFFLAPGVLHCGGGPGANSFDFVSAIDNWVERGAAPERIMGTRLARGGPQSPVPAQASMTRPICAYPALPHYSGAGDANDEKSFVCR